MHLHASRALACTRACIDGLPTHTTTHSTRHTTGGGAQVCGTPFYLSPELIRSSPYGESSDVWALGVLLYELLALKRPFGGANIAVLALNISRGKYDEAALQDSP